jgi:hypothetical protein
VRARVSALFFLLALSYCAQDKLILTDGSAIHGKVLEIGPDGLLLRTTSGTTLVPRTEAVLLEFAGGATERINDPVADKVYRGMAARTAAATRATDLLSRNMVSVNTLALCNADLSVFYERLMGERQAGIGLLAAVNVNRYANVHNAFVAILNNGKKTLDLGVFANYYPHLNERKTKIYFGVMLKYMEFSFSRVKEDTVAGGSNISFTPARSYQVSGLFTFGSHTLIGKQMFIRTILGAGACSVQPVHREQIRIITARNDEDLPLDQSVLPKIYLGINLGVMF